MAVSRSYLSGLPTPRPALARWEDDTLSFECHHNSQMDPSIRRAPGPASVRPDAKGYLVPAIDAPWVYYAGGHRRFFFKRGRIGSPRRGGLWQPLLNQGQIEIYLSCPYAKCRRLVMFGRSSNVTYGVHIEPDGYHSGVCIWCDSCHYHYWAVFEGWDRIHELPIKDIS